MIETEANLRPLMAASMNGDAASYRLLLAGCRSWLYDYFAHGTAPSQIDDLVEATLVSIHCKRTSYDLARPFMPWLAAIAHYRWIDHLRAHATACPVAAACPRDADAHDAAHGHRIDVTTLLAKLKANQAEAIRLVKLEGLSIAEAARRSSQSETLVKINIYRGIRSLTRFAHATS